MKIHVYSLCWNEARMLPYYVRHYLPIAEKFYIYDDGSTDGSLELLEEYPNIIVRSFENRGDSFVLNSQKFANESWKSSRGQADWVIICNIDEHLYHPNLNIYLQYCHFQDITLIPTKGYQMIAETFPITQNRLCDEIAEGMPWEQMDKLAIFNPNAIEEINYSVGRHKAYPKGRVLYPENVEVKLLHYKYLGLDYLVERNAELKNGLKEQDIKMRWGHKYLWELQRTEDDFNYVKSNAVRVI
jgi:glycosyltransferase involved in cell wall biosynthesis